MNAVVSSLKQIVRAGSIRRHGLIGVDVGTRFVKCAQVKRRNDNWTLQAARLVMIPPGRTLDEASIASGILGETLSGESLKAHGFKGPGCSCSFPTSVCEPRTIQLPSGTDEELCRMARQEPEFSDSDSEIEVDVWPTHGGTDESTAMTRVSAMSVPSSVATQCVNDLSTCDLNCEFLDGLPFAMTRAVELVDAESRQRPTAILDWGWKQPLLTISQAGTPSFSRVFRTCGLETLERNIRDEFGVEAFEATRLLQAFGMRESRNDASAAISRQIQRLVEPAVARVIEQLQRTFLFLSQQHADLTPSCLWITGGGGAIGGVAEELSRRLDLNCRVWSLPRDRVSSRLGDIQSLSLFAVATGLSLLSEECV